MAASPVTRIAEHCIVLYICLWGTTTASPQLRAVRNYPYTLEWRLSAAVTSRVLTVHHKTHSKGPFKTTWLRDGRSLLQKSSRFEYPVSNRQRW